MKQCSPQAEFNWSFLRSWAELSAWWFSSQLCVVRWYAFWGSLSVQCGRGSKGNGMASHQCVFVSGPASLSCDWTPGRSIGIHTLAATCPSFQRTPRTTCLLPLPLHFVVTKRVGRRHCHAVGGGGGVPAASHPRSEGGPEQPQQPEGGRESHHRPLSL